MCLNSKKSILDLEHQPQQTAGMLGVVDFCEISVKEGDVCVVCSVFAAGEREDAAYQLIIHNRSASQENHRGTQEYQSSMFVTFSLLKPKSLRPCLRLTDGLITEFSESS